MRAHDFQSPSPALGEKELDSRFPTHKKAPAEKAMFEEREALYLAVQVAAIKSHFNSDRCKCAVQCRKHK